MYQNDRMNSNGPNAYIYICIDQQIARTNHAHTYTHVRNMNTTTITVKNSILLFSYDIAFLFENRHVINKFMAK